MNNFVWPLKSISKKEFDKLYDDTVTFGSSCVEVSFDENGTLKIYNVESIYKQEEINETKN